MVDRLIESANAIPESELECLYQLQLLDYHLICARFRHGEPWMHPPSHPKTLKHLFHNDSKVLTALLREKQSILEFLAQPCATDAERQLVYSHPAWKAMIGKTPYCHF